MERVEIYEILEQIYQSNYDFQSFINAFGETANRLDNNLYKLADKLVYKNHAGINYHFKMGATRLVIVLEDEDFVIKIPLIGKYANMMDYCKSEVKIYNDAKKLCADCFLAGIVFVGYFKLGVPIYVMEKAVINKDKYMKNFFEGEMSLWGHSERTAISSYYDNEDYGTGFDNFYSAALSHYSDLDMQQLGLLNEVWHFTDIHSGNVGYINGMLVMIDYGGYNSY